MKRIINTLVILTVSMLAFSCQEREVLEVTMNESIVLDLSSGVTKADDTDQESYVEHIDIYIFKAEVQAGNTYSHGQRVYYGRYSVNNASTITLDAKRSSFVEDDRFYVYLIANTNLSKDAMAAVTTFNDLQNTMQEDKYLHFTALAASNAPKYFLMDAIAKDSSGNSPVQLYNGVPSDNTVLEAELKRAAAKVVINITTGADVLFRNYTLSDGNSDPNSQGQYYIRNLPYDTYLLSGVDASIIEAKRITTMPGTSKYFTWAPETVNDKVSLTAYVYPHHWTNASILTDETCVIMNLPMVFKPGTEEETEYRNSWYKIPMSKDQKFERNHYYEVNITLNRPGAISDSNPQPLNDIVYAVEDWTGVTVEVGKEENKPLYLQLNTDHVDMYNINTDAGTLHFASSSPIRSVTLKEAYYVNSTDTRVYLNQSSDSADRNVFSQINATYTANVLNGGITIFSPFVKEGTITDSHKNTIRFMTFEVENTDGLKALFTVAQYPTLYITNEHGIYSYREDFSGNISGVRWQSGSWQYVSSASQGSFFASKVAVINNNGSYSIRYADWSNGSYTSGSSLSMFNNPRMYHIHITATSKDYIVAKPLLDSNGYTEMTEENSRLVSPSFLIASQLGATETSGSSSGVDIQKAIRHCKEYMEVTDGKVYSDWRIPTKAEIDIIEKHQHTSPAMAEVLNGSHYYCAYNPEYAEYADPDSPYYSQRKDWIYTVRDIGNSGSVHVRCVHDAYGN